MSELLGKGKRGEMERVGERMVKCVSNEFQRDFKWISKQRSEKRVGKGTARAGSERKSKKNWRRGVVTLKSGIFVL